MRNIQESVRLHDGEVSDVLHAGTSRKPIRGRPLSAFIGDVSNQEEHFVDSIQCFENGRRIGRSPRAISKPCGGLPGSGCLRDKARTDAPRFSKSPTTAPPTVPVAPVTKIFMSQPLSADSSLYKRIDEVSAVAVKSRNRKLALLEIATSYRKPTYDSRSVHLACHHTLC